MGNFYTAVTKKRYSFEDLSNFKPTIEDVAYPLANSTLNRYGGLLPYHVNYSVAHHCIILARYCLDNNLGAELALKCLLHDVSEAFLLDLPSGLKDSVGIKYRDLEINITNAVLLSLGIDHYSYWLTDDHKVKELDNRIVANEINCFFNDHPVLIEDAKIREPLVLPKDIFNICHFEPCFYKTSTYLEFIGMYDYLMEKLNG